MRKTVATLKEMGIEVKYTEYACVGHLVAPRAYAEPGFVEWMLAQRRK